MSPANQSTQRHPRRLGKYEIICHIATGGMGTVYKAVDTKLGREVALKVLPAEMAERPIMVERFHREAKAAANLAHENIVTLLDDGVENGTHYLVMEFIEGIDLFNFISKKRRLDPEDARRILVQAAHALEHAHHQGMVHRDIKPSNFLLTKKEGKLLVKLTDMGLARRVDDNEFRVTKDGTTLGTIDYISPEQAHDAGKADIRSGIYSLGCTFYHMLVGEPPFPTGSLAERVLAHLKTEPPDVCKLNQQVPKTLGYILKKMLAKKPKDRYQTPKELLKDLENPDKVARLAHTNDRLATLEDFARAETPDDIPAAVTYGLEGTVADVLPATPPAPLPASVKKKKAREQQHDVEPEEEEKHGDEEDATTFPWWVFAIAGAGLALVLVAVWQILKNL